MRYITATEANQNLSRVLRDVAAGASYTVTSRGKPVAEIKAPDPNADLDKAEKRKRMEAMLERMKKRKPVIVGPWTRDELYERNR
jgi:antitoxin (DNA-binding transcriptional repressor) of toxin-antitoxin stability system